MRGAGGPRPPCTIGALMGRYILGLKTQLENMHLEAVKQLHFSLESQIPSSSPVHRGSEADSHQKPSP